MGFDDTFRQFQEWLKSPINNTKEFDVEGYLAERVGWDDGSIILINTPKQKLAIKPDASYHFCKIPRVEITFGISTANPQNEQELYFENCFINEIIISSNPFIRLTLKNCFVNRISFGVSIFYDIEFIEGCLLGITGQSHAADKHNPFHGRVTIKNLHLPRNIKEAKPDGSDADRRKLVYEFRNIRSYLSKKGDMLAAGIFHAAELTLERKDERLVPRVIGWTYERLSDYGNSISWPLIFMAGSYVIIFVTGIAPDLFCFNRSIIAVGCGAGNDLGWRIELCDSNFWRSVIYPLNAILNPLNLLSPRVILVSSTVWWAIAHTVVGLFGTLNLALCVLAVRRRFRLEKAD